MAIGLLLPVPSSALAEEEPGPRFACAQHALQVMAAEVSGLRLQCEVAGARSGDQDFVIQLDQQPADVAEAGAPALGQRMVCSGSLQSGAGACIGAVFNTASPAFGTTRLSAILLPSGTRLEDAPPPQAAPGDGVPVHFEPLSDSDP